MSRILEEKRSKSAEQSLYRILRAKILASMILVPVAPFILVVIIGFHHFAGSLQSTTISRLIRIVDDHRRTIELFLNERKTDLQFVADSYRFDDLARPAMLEEVFRNLQKKSVAFVDLGIFDESGVHIAYSGPYKLTGKVYREAEWFKEVMKKGYYVSDVFLGYRQVPHFVVALLKKDKDQVWVIRATIDTLLFNDIVEKVRIGKTGESYILNKDGLFQTERRSGGALMEKDTDGMVSLQPHPKTMTFVKRDASGEIYLYSTTWLKDNNWLLVVRQEKADAFKALRSATYMVILISILGGVTIVAMAFYMTNRIFTELRRIEDEKSQLSQQLIIASRLAEIGEMSAGFAHEINNPLQIIRAEQTLIETIIEELKEKGDLKGSEELKELEDSLRQIRVQTDRCGGITQALLKFAREKETEPTAVDLKRFLPEVIGLVIRKADVEGIDVQQVISDDIPLLHVDASQLQQVLVNLLNNAIYAIVEQHGTAGGRLEISAKATDGRVEIAVMDNGFGISPENMEKIFTPFFTTKPVGRGTGLGLSVCYSIIEKMGGVLGVQSEQGKGSTFTIHLPVNR
ncbi:MAG: ATP-binding protein [Thermodesulfobacteriota bacterium]|nr:ATP-binding protein [Thermodesulfobacteriota bacterium]